jgi:hypothetical protein
VKKWGCCCHKLDPRFVAFGAGLWREWICGLEGQAEVRGLLWEGGKTRTLTKKKKKTQNQIQNGRQCLWGNREMKAVLGVGLVAICVIAQQPTNVYGCLCLYPDLFLFVCFLPSFLPFLKIVSFIFICV